MKPKTRIACAILFASLLAGNASADMFANPQARFPPTMQVKFMVLHDRLDATSFLTNGRECEKWFSSARMRSTMRRSERKSSIARCKAEITAALVAAAPTPVYGPVEKVAAQ